jgi:hypothetical protein
MKFTLALAALAMAANATAGIDTVFIIDESGSMANDQAAVKANANTIFAALPPGSHAAVVGYGASSHGISQNAHVHQTMTPIPATFGAGVASLVASGGTERGWAATWDAASDLVYNVPLNYTGDPVCHIIITDERLDQGGKTRPEAIVALQNQPGIFFAVVPVGSIYVDAHQAALATGGAIFGLEAFRASPTPIIEAVIKACVAAAIPVVADIKPTSCPNPVKLTSKGVVPVALLGSEDFDASSIDPASLMINGECPAIRTALEDVSAPFTEERSDPPAEGDCTTDGPDGYDDMTAKFDKECVITTTDLIEQGTELWTITGTYTDGDGNTREFSADDVVRVMP